MNFAPVVDINSNPRNPIIGIRSFGEDPETVLTFGERALKGYQQAGIMATLKHFPGHGDVELDSHEGLPIIHKSLVELEQVELLPFARLSLSSDLVMTGHLLVPALDGEHCSTLSAKTINYLREKIGFQGAIITDSLVMQGVLKTCQTVDEAAIQALNAGCDILLLGGMQLNAGHVTFELTVNDIQRIHRSIIDAVKSGRVSEARVNEALDKILKLKERSIINHPQPINRVNHHALAQEIASKALTSISNECHEVSSLSEKKIAFFAPKFLQESINQTSLLQIGYSTQVYYFEEIENAKDCAETADILIACSYNAWKNFSLAQQIQVLLDTNKPLILLVLRDPLDASLFPTANLIFTTFSPTVPSLEAVFKKLQSSKDN
jgi:beta-N-acetylhexosaminidase